MNMNSTHRFHTSSTTPFFTEAGMCRCDLSSGSAFPSMVAVFGVPASWQAIYQNAYDQASRQVRLKYPGRPVPQGLN